MVKAAKIAIDFLPLRHPGYQKLDERSKDQLKRTSQEVIDSLSRLKPILSERYEDWLSRNPRGLEMEAKARVLKGKDVEAPRIPQRTPKENSNNQRGLVPFNSSSARYDGLPVIQAPDLAGILGSQAGLPFVRSTTNNFEIPTPRPQLQASASNSQTPASSLGRSTSRLNVQHQSTQGFAPAPDSKISYPILRTISYRKPISFSQDVSNWALPSSQAQAIPEKQPLNEEKSIMFGNLRMLELPTEMIDTFVALASHNTERRIETCGLLLGKLSRGRYTITTLLIPNQKGSADTCEMLDEENIFDYQDKRDLLTLGWIHTHPSMTCFLSSVDLHTHCGFQMSLNEAIAVVCAPQSTPAVGVFRLVVPDGLELIAKCNERGFHPHPPDRPIYTDADSASGHVKMVRTPYDLVDFRAASERR